MNKKRIPQIITAAVGVLALGGLSLGVVAVASARETAPPVEAGVVVGLTDPYAFEDLASASDEVFEIASAETVRIEAANAAAAQAEADRIAAEQAEADRQAAEQEQDTPPAQGGTDPATPPASDPPTFQCPPGAVDAGDGASCWWEYCFSIQPIPNPDYPECSSTFKP